MDGAEYAETMKAWIDEAEPICDGFRSLFADDTEGMMRYFFALHYMVTRECMKRGIPEEAFTKAIPSLIAIWHATGKKDGVEFMCVAADKMSEVQAEIRKLVEGWGEKPSSDT